MMTDIACFCGCLYSFDGGAGACPGCGECAAVPTGSALPRSGRGQPREQRSWFHLQDGSNGQAAGSSSGYDRVPVSDLPDGVGLAGALAGDPRERPGHAGIAMFAFVTGASSGVGEEFACRLAADDWDLAITAHRGDRPGALPERPAAERE